MQILYFLYIYSYCCNVINVFYFFVSLQSSWVISVELAIGPEEGISYLTDKGSTVTMTHTHIHTHKEFQVGPHLYLVISPSCNVLNGAVVLLQKAWCVITRWLASCLTSAAYIEWLLYSVLMKTDGLSEYQKTWLNHLYLKGNKILCIHGNVGSITLKNMVIKWAFLFKMCSKYIAEFTFSSR